MAASPPQEQARSAGGDGHVSLFLDTDLGTRLALLVAADSTIRHLKAQVAVEHAAAFPDLGPVAVKSFQVRRKGAMYHLSDSMIVRSAFARVKVGCFLHVKMAAAVADTHCCRDAPAMEDRGRSSEGCLRVDVDRCVRELPATISEIENDVLPQGLEGGEGAAVLNNVHAHDTVPNDVLLSSSSQQNTERKKNEVVSLASNVLQKNSVPVIDKAKSYRQRIKHDDRTEGAYVNSTYVANVDRSINQSNLSWLGEEAHARKEDVLHGDGDHDVGFVSGNKQVEIKEGMLEETYALDDLSQEKERERARKTGSFDTSAGDPIRETNESEIRGKSDMVPLETNSNSRGELSNSSFQQEVHRNVQEDSIQLDNPSIAGKNKKRKRRQSVASKEVVSAQEMTKPSTGAVEVPKAIGEVLLHKDNQGLQGDGACNVELTSRDKTMIRPSDMLLISSQLNKGRQETKDVQLVSNAQATTDLVADQGNIELVHKGSRNPTIGDTVNSTSEVVGGEEKSTKGSNAPWDGGEKHARKKQAIDDDGCHDEGVVETSNTEKASRSKNILEKIHTAGNTSQGKKRKKEKKVSSADIASLDTAGKKEQCGYGENATKSDMVSTQGEIVDDPFKQQISSNVEQGDSSVMENPSGDGKQKKKRRRRSESSKGTVPTQDVTKSSELITNEISIQNANAAPLDAKQTTPGTIGEATVSGLKKLDERLDTATANVIDEVLADLRSTDSLSKDLDGDLLTAQTHLGNNQNVLGLLGNTGDKGGVSAALPPKYPAAVHSDAPMSSPRHKKSKGNQLKVLSIVLGSSSSGGVPEENANTELRESDSLRCSDKTSDLEDILTENIAVQVDDKTKPAKRQRKKISLKHVCTDDGNGIQSPGEQINQAATEDFKGANATKTDLVQGGSVIGTSASTVGKLQQKSRRSSKTRTPKIQEVNHSTHGQDSPVAKDSQFEHVFDIGGSHHNENAGAPAQSPVIQKDAKTLKSASSNAQKGRKKSSKTELQSQDSALEHGCDAYLMNSKAERGTVHLKSSVDAVESNDLVVVHHDNDKISFLEHFSPREMNDPSVSAENKETNDDTVREVKDKKKSKRKPDMQSQRAGSSEPNDPLESHLHTDKTSLTNHFGTENVGVPSVTAENMSRQDGIVKKVKDKKESKRKLDLVNPVSEQDNTNGDHQDTDNCTQDLPYSVVQKGRMEQDSRKENNDKAIQNDGLPQQEIEDAQCDSTLEKKLHRSKFNADSQNNLPIDKDHAHMSKEQRKFSSQTKHHAKSRNDDGSINGRTGSNTKAVNNLVKSFSMSPPASSDSTEGTPQNANRYRVAVRKVPRKRYEQTSDKSKKDNSKRGTTAIFNDAISEGSDDALDTVSEKAAMEASSDDSSTCAGPGGNLNEIVSHGIGFSSAGHDGSDVPDDDGIVSRSQKSLREGLHIGSILRGSSSYKKARQKQTEELDDTEVPDSQPADGL